MTCFETIKCKTEMEYIHQNSIFQIHCDNLIVSIVTVNNGCKMHALPKSLPSKKLLNIVQSINK